MLVMKISMTFLFISISLAVWSQKSTQTTDAFTVEGQVKKTLTIGLSDLEKYPIQKIDEVVITNHTGEPRGTAKELKGVLVKDVLKDLEFKEESPKLLSEFYFVFVAIDDYKVVYSWNEIFNSPTGDNLFLITSRDGIALKDMKDRILVLTPSDFKTGRRHVKGLNKILVLRAE